MGELYEGEKSLCAHLTDGTTCSAPQDPRAWGDDTTDKPTGKGGPSRQTRRNRQKKADKKNREQRIMAQFANCVMDDIEEDDGSYPEINEGHWEIEHLAEMMAGEESVEKLQAMVARKMTQMEAESRSGYKKAMDKEIGRMMENAVWYKPVGHATISEGSRVYKADARFVEKGVELPPDERTDKARFCLLGHRRYNKQGKGVMEKPLRQVGEFWAPAGSLSAYRLVAAHAAARDGILETIDLDSAYAQVSIDEEDIYIEIPEFVLVHLNSDWQKWISEAKSQDPSGRIAFPLKKALYGRAASGKDFIEAFQTHLVQNGWVRSKYDGGLFVKEWNGEYIVLLNYVDDAMMSLMENQREAWDEVRRGWKSGDPRASKRFIGMVVENCKESINLDQSEYLREICKTYEKMFGKKVKPRVTLPKVPEPLGEEEKTKKKNDAGSKVRGIVGSLAYVVRGTRGDVVKPWHAMKQRSCTWDAECGDFLYATICHASHGDAKLSFKIPKNKCGLDKWNAELHSDSDYRAPKSTAGRVVTAVLDDGDEIITYILDWNTGTQRTAKLSSAESELTAAVICAKNGIQWSGMVNELGGSKCEPPTYTVWVDNAAVIPAARKGWSSSLVHTDRCCGVGVEWLRQQESAGLFKLRYVPTYRNLADPMTKVMAGGGALGDMLVKVGNACNDGKRVALKEEKCESNADIASIAGLAKSMGLNVICDNNLPSIMSPAFMAHLGSRCLSTERWNSVNSSGSHEQRSAR